MKAQEMPLQSSIDTARRAIFAKNGVWAFLFTIEDTAMWAVYRKYKAKRQLERLRRAYDETARQMMLMRHMQTYFQDAHQRMARTQKE